MKANKRRALTVLDLLLVTWRLLEGLDDQRRGGWDDIDLGLSVLDGELDGDSQTLPVAGVLGNVFRNLFRRLFSVCSQSKKHLFNKSIHSESCIEV